LRNKLLENRAFVVDVDVIKVKNTGEKTSKKHTSPINKPEPSFI
jgi:hypothetical protein